MRSKQRNLASSSQIYWNSVDSAGGSNSSSSGGGGASRNYVDPWDLENYAYLRRHSVAAAAAAASIDDATQPIYQSGSRSVYACRRRSPVEPDYWYTPSTSAREPGYDAPASVEEIYFRPTHHDHTTPRPFSATGCYYHHHHHQRQPIYEDEAMMSRHHHYAAPVIRHPLYDHLSEIEQVETLEELRTREIMMRRRGNVSSRSAYPREECYYHGRPIKLPLHNVSLMYPEEESSVDEVDEPRYKKPSHMGLSAYGHLKIDYTNSWNSLHRKIASK